MSNKYEELHQAIMADFCNHMLAQTDDIDYIDDYLLHLYREVGVAVSNAVNGLNDDMIVNGWDGYRTTPKGNKFLGLSTDCDPWLEPVCVAIVVSPTTGHVVPFMPTNGNVFKAIQASGSDGYRWEEASSGDTHDIYKMMADVDDFIESGAPDPDSREEDSVYVWQDGEFTTMYPKDYVDSVDEGEDDDEDEEPIGEDQELDEDPILAANGMPKKLADILRKAVANGTQITGVGPGGCAINVGADGSMTTVGGTDITGLFGASAPKPIDAEPLNGYPLKEYTIELSEECTNHIRKQAERLNRIMGIDVDDSIESIQQNITKVFIGVLHQTLQAKDQNESMDIDKFYTDNLYGDRFYSGKVEDGKVYSDLDSPVQCSDTVIAKEILDLVHKALEDSDKNTQTTNSVSKPETAATKPTIEDFKAVLSKIGFEDDGFGLVAEGIDCQVWLCESMWENGLLIQTKYLIDDEMGDFSADSIDDIIPSFMAELEKQTCGFNKDAYYDRWEATEKYADEYESGPNARYYMTLECRIEEADAYYDWCCEVYSRLSNLK